MWSLIVTPFLTAHQGVHWFVFPFQKTSVISSRTFCCLQVGTVVNKAVLCIHSFVPLFCVSIFRHQRPAWLICTCESLSSRYDGTRKSTMKEHTTYIYKEKAHREWHTKLCQTDHCWVGERKTWGRGITLFLGTPWAQETVLGFTGLNNLNRFQIWDHALSWDGILDKYCLGS